MKIKKLNQLEYRPHHGEEKKIMQILYQSKEPVLIKIKNFTGKFSVEYFEKNIQGTTKYSTFDNYRLGSHHAGDFSTVMSQIKKNMPHRIFCQCISREQSARIERHIPLWQKIPYRPRFFNDLLKVTYFFGGKGSETGIHFDREHCCLLHLCLGGKKELLLFTEAQSEHLYKIPYVGDSLIDFSEPLSTLYKTFPRLKQAEGYKIVMEKGDMLFLPKNCWHYTRYLDAASSATYSFYPQKILQFYGCLTGWFYQGYKTEAGIFGISHWSIFKKFSRHYAFSTGTIKFFLKIIETVSFVFLLPTFSMLGRVFYHLKLKQRK